MAKAEPKQWQHPSLLVILVAGTITVFFLIAIGRELFQNQTVHHQLATLSTQVSQESQRQKQLQDLLTYLASPTFQERQARLQLGLKADGEKVVVVPDAGAPTVQPTAANATAASADQSNPSKWWSYFFGSQNKVE